MADHAHSTPPTSRRRALFAAASAVVMGGGITAGAAASVADMVEQPDAELLALCGELRELQAEWQALWNLTSDKGNIFSAADQALDDFEDNVWPGYLADPEGDAVAGLATLPATTIEGFRAKGAALRAVSDVGGYSGTHRDDECKLMAAFLKEIAGRAFMPIGEGVAV